MHTFATQMQQLACVQLLLLQQVKVLIFLLYTQQTF